MKHIVETITKHLIYCAVLICIPIISCGPTSGKDQSEKTISIAGEVKTPMDLSISELSQMPSISIRDVLLIKEKNDCSDPEEFISGAAYRGVLLRDLLLKAGMKYVRKWEPGVYIRVYGSDGKTVVFSFGEIFYSSIGRSVMIAYEEKADAIPGTGDLIVTTDLRAGRHIKRVSRIEVNRVNVEMLAYEDKKENILRPPTLDFQILDHKTGNTRKMDLEILQQLPRIHIPFAVMAGDCEGFRGIHAFEGVLIKDILISSDFSPCGQDYNRIVLVSSEDGFCAVFSFGELFNSRLNNNLVIAYKKDGAFLNTDEGFSMSVAGEDNLGGRSVKRIHKLEIF